MFATVFEFAAAHNIRICEGVEDNAVTDPRVAFRGPVKGAISYSGSVLMPNLSARNNRNKHTLMALLHEVMHVFVGECPTTSNEDAILGLEWAFVQTVAARGLSGEWNEAFRAWNTTFTSEFIERYIGSDPYETHPEAWTELTGLTEEGQTYILESAVEACKVVYPGTVVDTPEGVRVGARRPWFWKFDPVVELRRLTSRDWLRVLRDPDAYECQNGFARVLRPSTAPSHPRFGDLHVPSWIASMGHEAVIELPLSLVSPECVPEIVNPYKWTPYEKMAEIGFRFY